MILAVPSGEEQTACFLEEASEQSAAWLRSLHTRPGRGDGALMKRLIMQRIYHFHIHKAMLYY